MTLAEVHEGVGKGRRITEYMQRQGTPHRRITITSRNGAQQYLQPTARSAKRSVESQQAPMKLISM